MIMDNVKQNYRVRNRLDVFYSGGPVRLTSDGATLACACADEVKLVDAQTGAVIRTFPGDSEPVTSLACSIDGKYVFAASRSLQLRCLDAATGRHIKTFKGHRAPIADMAVDSSGALLATASADRSVRVWDIDGGYCTHHFTGHSGVVLCCIFHPTQLLLVTCGDDAQVRVWDLVAKNCIANLKAHFSAVTSLSFSSDGWTLLSGGRDGVVVCWNLRNFEKLNTIPVYEALEGVVALPSTVPLPPATDSGTKKKKKTLDDATSAPPPLCFATGGEKGVVKLWRADTGQCVFDECPPGVGAPTAAGGIVELRPLPQGRGVLAATQDCRLLFLSATLSDGVQMQTTLTTTTTDRRRRLVLDRQLIGSNDEVTDVKFIFAEPGHYSASIAPAAATSGTGNRSHHPPAGPPTHVVLSTNSEHIRVHRVDDLSCTATLEGHKDIVLCMDVVKLKSGKTLMASGSKDNDVRLWTVPQGACIAVGSGHVGAVSAMAFARRTKGFLVSGGADKLLKVWDVASLTLDPATPAPMRATAAVAAHDKDINAVAVAPNDSLVASASQDRSVKIWKLPDLVLATTLRGHKRGVWSVAFSPVDQAVATSSGDKTVKLWALKDGSCLRTFEGHLASVLRVEFLSAGTQLLTAGGDGLLKLWSVRTAECINTFDAHDDKVWALAVGGTDGAMLASGGGDGGVALWEDCTAADVAEAAADAETVMLQEQDLSNAVQSRNWRRAASLAFEMRRPGKLLAVITNAFEGGTETGQRIVTEVVASLTQDHLKQCLEYCREWNTNARTCFAAQETLHAVLTTHSPGELLSLPGIGPVLEGLWAYTQRHFARADRLHRSTFVVDYMLDAMNVLQPPEGEAEGQETAGDEMHPAGTLRNGNTASEPAGTDAHAAERTALVDGSLHEHDAAMANGGGSDFEALSSGDGGGNHVGDDEVEGGIDEASTQVQEEPRQPRTRAKRAAAAAAASRKPNATETRSQRKKKK